MTRHPDTRGILRRNTGLRFASDVRGASKGRTRANPVNPIDRSATCEAHLTRPFERGCVVGGKYELVTLLGRGSMGEVWVAHHQSLGEDVAIKLLSPESGTCEIEDPVTASARFRFEAQIAARLSRKTRHIVRVTDHGDDGGGLAYLVMELLEGCTLEKRLLQYGEMPPDAVSQLIAQTARALECAHAEQVVHRDLKPANVFLAHDEEGRLLVKLLDFGIARASHTQRRASPFSTGQGVVFGTPGYMSPEQSYGTAIDARADLWAMATVAYEALTGELPIPGAYVQELQNNLLRRRLVPIHERNPRLPAGLAGFFERAFAQRVEHRFASASELASSFEQAIAGHTAAYQATARMRVVSERQSGDTRPMAVESPPRSASRWSRRAGWLFLAAFSVALPTLVAAEMLRRPLGTHALPATSTAVASARAAAPWLASEPQLQSPLEPASAVTDIAVPAADTAGLAHTSRPPPVASVRARPTAPGAATGSEPPSSPHTPRSGASVNLPPVAPPPGTATDRSATL
jgi:serine/threonine protein kinase